MTVEAAAAALWDAMDAYYVARQRYIKSWDFQDWADPENVAIQAQFKVVDTRLNEARITLEDLLKKHGPKDGLSLKLGTLHVEGKMFCQPQE
jgi:hypothetical protein